MKSHALFIIPVLGMIITGLVYPISLYAQAPQAITYQAIVRGSDGNVLADQFVSFQITVHRDGADGPEVYCETHTATTSPLGLVALEIGNGALVFGSFQAIDWSIGVYFFEVEMDAEGGADYVALGTTQLLSVPYALYSEKTGQTYLAGTGIDITDEVITNTAPDQEVVISEGGGIGVTGGYPNYTLTNTAPDQEVVLNDGDGISTAGTYPNFTITNTAPNAYHTGDATGGDVLAVVGFQGYPVSATPPAMDQVLQWDGSQWNPTTLPGALTGWSLTGNSGTDPEVNFLGTTDNQPLRFRVNNQLAGEINPINDNTFLGGLAGEQSTGSSNVAVGAGALFNNYDNSRSTAIGYHALYNTDNREEGRETYNTALGYEALKGSETPADNTGQYNTAIGDRTMYSNSVGYWNTAGGANALYSNTNGYGNTAIGRSAMFHNTEGNNNTAVGRSALFDNTEGNGNTAMGEFALRSNAANSRSTAIGYYAMYNADNREEGRETYNTALGYEALKGSDTPVNNTGTSNTALGSQTMYNNESGGSNVAIGRLALFHNISGNFNVAIGQEPLYHNTNGSRNIAIGYIALDDIIDGNNNTAVGHEALSNTEGSNNTAVGYLAGDLRECSNSTFLGVSAYPNAEGYTNCMALGYNARVDASNKTVIGNTTVTSIGGYADWTNFSDGRFKKNVWEDVPGLEFIKQLRPITYNLDITSLNADLNRNRQKTMAEGKPSWQESQEDIVSKEAKEKIVYTGFIAQEVEAAAQSLGYDFSGVDAPQNPDGHYGLRYAAFVVPLVKAVQEQQVMIEEQQSMIRNQQAIIESLQQKLTALETEVGRGE